jgi:CO/xanthine dehydrogenase Mo-binding subunit
MDGSVTVKCGVQDIGGGQASSLASITAEVLGVPMEDVKVFIGDTALTPLAGTTTATRQLYMSGNATLKAATEVRKNLLGKAGELLEANPEDLILRERKISVKGDPASSMDLETVVKAAAGDGIPLYNVAQFNGPFRELIDFKTGQGQVFPDFTFGSYALEVAVDIETGKVRVLKLVACFDVGQAINPLSAEGQIEGGALYGLGYGLSEDVIIEKGITLTPSFSEYLIPTSLDAPHIKTIMIQSGDGAGPFGAKGIGEPSCVPIAPALANAVCNAIGTRIYDLPLTPERIVMALKRMGG